MKLLCVIPFHKGDYESAKNLVKWIGELGGCRPYSLLLARDVTVDKNIATTEILEPAKKLFHDARMIVIPVPPERQGWPSGGNFMFVSVCKYIYENYKTAFFWMEPDCIPLCKDWMGQLANEYEFSPKKYLGCVIEQTKDKELPKKHMSGCGIYPNDAWNTFRQFQSVMNGTAAWDMVGADTIMPSTCHTPLIQCFWGEKDLAPEFVKQPSPATAKNQLPLSFLKPEAVLFHRDKKQTLISLLREKFFGGKGKTAPQQPSVVE